MNCPVGAVVGTSPRNWKLSDFAPASLSLMPLSSLSARSSLKSFAGAAVAAAAGLSWARARVPPPRRAVTTISTPPRFRQTDLRESFIHGLQIRKRNCRQAGAATAVGRPFRGNGLRPYDFARFRCSCIDS